MNRQEAEHYRQMLLKMLDETEDTIELDESHREPNRTSIRPANCRLRQSPCRPGRNCLHLEMNNALKVHGENIIKDIKEALVRIDKGTYGICAGCGGRHFPRKRLRCVHMPGCASSARRNLEKGSTGRTKTG